MILSSRAINHQILHHFYDHQPVLAINHQIFLVFFKLEKHKWERDSRRQKTELGGSTQLPLTITEISFFFLVDWLFLSIPAIYSW